MNNAQENPGVVAREAIQGSSRFGVLSEVRESQAVNGFTVPQRKNLLWLAVDLDGTLAEPIWTPENPTSAIGNPIERNVAKLREAVANGYKIVIHTSRPWSDYEAIEAWCWHYEIPFKAIECGKLLAARYVDDRAVQAEDASWIP